MYFNPFLTVEERRQIIQANMHARMCEMTQDCVDELMEEERQKAADAKILPFKKRGA